LLFDSILGFGPENLNGTWAQQKKCATERMWDRTFGLFDTENLNGKGARQGKQWAIESMWEGVCGVLRHGDNKGRRWATESMDAWAFDSGNLMAHGRNKGNKLVLKAGMWDRTFGFLNQEIYINGTGVQQGQKMGQWKHVRERVIYMYIYICVCVYVPNITQYV
jgi:hypothetical protein